SWAGGERDRRARRGQVGVRSGSRRLPTGDRNLCGFDVPLDQSVCSGSHEPRGEVVVGGQGRHGAVEVVPDVGVEVVGVECLSGDRRHRCRPSHIRGPQNGKTTIVRRQKRKFELLTARYLHWKTFVPGVRLSIRWVIPMRMLPVPSVMPSSEMLLESEAAMLEAPEICTDMAPATLFDPAGSSPADSMTKARSPVSRVTVGPGVDRSPYVLEAVVSPAKTNAAAGFRAEIELMPSTTKYWPA